MRELVGGGKKYRTQESRKIRVQIRAYIFGQLTAYIFGQVPNLIESPIPQLDMEMAGPAMQGGCGDHTGLQGKCPAQHLACSGRKVLS